MGRMQNGRPGAMHSLGKASALGQIARRRIGGRSGGTTAFDRGPRAARRVVLP